MEKFDNKSHSDLLLELKERDEALESFLVNYYAASKTLPEEYFAARIYIDSFVKKYIPELKKQNPNTLDGVSLRKNIAKEITKIQLLIESISLVGNDP